jgi:hypothetical protein
MKRNKKRKEDDVSPQGFEQDATKLEVEQLTPSVLD